MNSGQRSGGFTVIELLVVVTIIVVLLALLTPALERAVYQAELVVCAGNLRLTGSGVMSYSQDNKRSYPDRPGNAARGAWRPMMLSGSGTTVNGITIKASVDDRPKLEPYIGLDPLLDPLLPPVDLSDEANPPATYVFCGYNLWFGWEVYEAGRVYPGLKKYGDRLTYLESRFDVLACDIDAALDGTAGQGSHPDRLDTLNPSKVENGGNPQNGYYTYSFWTIARPRDRGPIDRNFAHTDGSVRRLNDLIFKPGGKPDDRVIELPARADGSATAREFLPR